MPRPAVIAVLSLVLPLVGGCGLLRPGVSADLTLRSADDPSETLPAHFEHAFYSFDSEDRITMVMLQGPIDRPQRAMTIRTFWKPRPGRTPLEPEATNAMVRYVRFVPAEREGDEPPRVHVGVYTGAGYLRHDLRPGRDHLPVTLRQATLRLVDASPGYASSVEEASLVGRIALRRDDAATARLTRQLESAVTEALSYPRFVRSDGR